MGRPGMVIVPRLTKVAPPPHPDGGGLAAGAISLHLDEARAADLRPLGDQPAQRAVVAPTRVAQVAPQHRGGRAGRRVLRHARSGREHADTHVRGWGALRRSTLPFPITILP